MDPVLNISDTVKILSGRIETEINRLNVEALPGNNQIDSLVFIGNWQDAIPRSIWVDDLLSAVDVRCWGIIRTQAVNGSAVMLSLNNLLKETLGYSNATVSRVIYVLRLTRWISLCSKLRTERGKFRGNIYAIHDQPVSLEDAIYLDSHYIEFVKKQTSHSNNAIRTLAKSIWQFISESIHRGSLLQTLVEKTSISGCLNQIVSSSLSQSEKTYHKTHIYNLNNDMNSHVQKLNVDTKHQVQFLNVADEKNESDENQQHNIQVQKLNVAPICSSSCSSSSLKKKEINNKTPTTNSEGMAKQEKKEIQENLIYPNAFNSNENKLATMYLERISPDLQQNFLDETAAIIKQRSKTNNPIRNPVGYLAWLCNEHGKGNTFLTSAYLNYQQQRERKANREKKIEQQQHAMTQAALRGEAMTGVTTEKTEPKYTANEEKSSKVTVDRWDGISRGIKAKQHQDGEG